MKIRHFIPTFMAVAATVFTACSNDFEASTFKELQVSTSYVSIAAEGGSATMTVSAASEWAFENVFQIVSADKKDTTYQATPAWLTLSQTSGAAGEAELTFSAESTLDGRTATLKLTSGGLTQEINIIQGLATVSEATCAEVIAGPDAKTYRVTGKVTAIANTSYGNWYLNDGTGEIYIYGTVDDSGKYNWSSFGIDVGDVVTVQGPKTTYNGTVELVDVSVVSVKKSLVKIEEGMESAFDADGGDVLVRLTVNGDGPFIAIDEEAQAWVGITSIVKTDTTTNITLRVAPNTEEAARKATVSFTSSNGSATSTVAATISQMGLSGTLTNPFNVEDAIAYCQTLTGASANDFYIKGRVSRIANNGEFGSYGNATFFISDDGEFLGEDDKNPDKAHDFEVYRALYFGNEKWTEGHANISVGDEVIICGKLTLYKGIAETSQNAAYVYSINSVSTDENGLGSLAHPFNIAGAMTFINNGGSNNVYVKGVVSQIANNGQFGAQYGNGTFWISDDGTYNDDLSKDFEAYRVLWLGNRKWQEGDALIAVGDEVILHGQLTKYGSTYETSSGKAYVYSVNGTTE